MSRIRLTNKSSVQDAPPAGKLQLEAVNNAFVVQDPSGNVASFSGVNTGDQDSETLSVLSALDADYSTLQDVIDTQLSTGIVGDAELISDAGDGMVKVAESNVLLRIGDGDTEEMRFFKVPESLGLVLEDGALNYVYARFDVGGVRYEATTTERSDTNTNILIGTVYRSGTTVHINNNFRVRANDNLRRVALRFVETMPFARAAGGIVSEVGTRNLHITAGRWWECTNPFTTPTFDSSDADTFTAAYSDGSDGWTEQVAQTQIDNAHYDDLTGTLAEALPNRYLTRWVYLETDGHVIVVYGRDQHVTEALAEAEAEPPRPPRIQAAGRLLARIIIKVGASAFTSVKNVDTGIEFTSPTTHNGLGGLQGGEAGFYGHLTEAQQTSAPVKFGDSAGLDVGVANGVAGLDANGLVPITQIPPAAIERLVVVADEAARFALTTATVQEGDTVKQADTGLMYLVVDEDNLGNASGYVEYTAGQAASVAYSGITGKPPAIDALDDLTPDADKLPYYTGPDSAALTDFTAAGRALLGGADAAAQRTTLGLGDSAVRNVGSNEGDVPIVTNLTQFGLGPIDVQIPAVAADGSQSLLVCEWGNPDHMLCGDIIARRSKSVGTGQRHHVITISTVLGTDASATRTVACIRRGGGTGSPGVLAKVTYNGTDYLALHITTGTNVWSQNNRFVGRGVGTFQVVNNADLENITPIESTQDANTALWFNNNLVWHSGNTVVDGNGFVKEASPVLRVFHDHIEPNGQVPESVRFEKLGIGYYKISGTLGFAQQGWYYESPKDRNGVTKVVSDYEEIPEQDGTKTIIVRTYEPAYSDGRLIAGAPMDIPDGRWVDIRLHAPEPAPED